MKVLSIRQPWAYLILHGGKDIENRTWSTPYRGPLLIHAPKMIETWHIKEGMPAEYLTGGIVGMAELVDVVTESTSPWFEGPYGFVLSNAKPLPFVAMRGKQGLFEAELVERR